MPTHDQVRSELKVMPPVFSPATQPEKYVKYVPGNDGVVSVESGLKNPMLSVPKKNPKKITTIPVVVSGVAVALTVIGKVNVPINAASQLENVPAVVVCVNVAQLSAHVPDSEPPSCVVAV